VPALAGCAGSNSAASAKPVSTVELSSPSFIGLIPAQYTCDGKDISPALEWSALPADTASLVLFVIGATPEPSTNTEKLTIEWAIANINPQLHKLAPGRVPQGAVVGVNSDGQSRYSICPKRGEETQYRFELYGLPASKFLPPHFAGAPAYKVLTATHTPATASGSFSASYKRR
jgi:phosphatidylethanolamine-binding protein (PEBP) family uncharacterized protein